MTRIGDSDFDADMSMLDIEHSQDAALSPLLLASSLMRSGKPLPKRLADYIALAFEAAAQAPPGKPRGTALLQGLHLTQKGPRQKSLKAGQYSKEGQILKSGQDWLEVGRAMENLLSKNILQKVALQRLHQLNGLSRSTNLRKYNYYLKAKKADEEASNEWKDELDTANREAYQEWLAERAHTKADRKV